MVTAVSSNPTLTPAVAVSGSGVDRTVTINSAANAGGIATMTLTATDANGATASELFTVTVPLPCRPAARTC